MCLRQMYERENVQLQCPLCRNPITTIVQLYPSHADHRDIERVLAFTNEYNYRFDDERSWWRRIVEFPYVFRMIWRGLFNPRFIIYFIRHAFFYRFLFIIVLYILMPFDLIPERVFGFIGLIDDLFVVFLVLTFMLSMTAVSFMRRRGI